MKQRRGAWWIVAALAAIASFVWLSFREDDAPAASPGLRNATTEAPAATPPLQAPLARETRSSSDALVEAASDETPASAKAPETAAASPDDYVIEVLDHQGAPMRDAIVQVRLEILGLTDPKFSLFGTHRCDPPPAPPQIRVPRASILRSLELAAETTRSYGAARGFELSFGLRDPLAPCARRRVTGAEDEERKIVLQLEPTARVRVEAYDATGRSLARELRFVLRRPLAREASFMDRVSAKSAMGFHVFSLVPLGAELEAVVEDPSGAMLETVLRIESPAVAGTELTVPLRMEHEAPRLSGRLLDAQGTPLRNAEFEFSAHRQWSNVGASGQTDGEGRFALFLGANLREFGQPEALGFRWKPTSRATRPDGEEAQELRIVAPTYPESGILDLGDLHLGVPGQESLLAAGLVVDEAGQPLANVALQLWDVWPPKQTGPWDDWRVLNGERFRTNAEGQFEIRSKEQVRALRIAPRLEEHYAANPLTVDPGTRDLRLVLGRAYRISGLVLLPAGAERSPWHVSPHDGKNARIPVELSADGSFVTEALKPGSYRIDVLLDGDLIHRVPAVAVGDPAQPSDPRLNPLDLREALRRWSLRVLGPAGEPWTAQPIHLLPTTAIPIVASPRPEEGGRFRAWLPSEATQLRVIVEGAQSGVLAWSEGEQVVQLTAASTHRLEIAGLDGVPPDVSVSFGFTLPAGEDPHPADIIRARAISGVAKVQNGMILERGIPLPGRTFVIFHVRSLVADHYVQLPPVALDIPEVPSAEPLRVAPAPGTLENALAELRRRAQR
ncbi:MAG: hypothetical protein JNM84_14545 [Planctomycetes bacterium]|nr:hypothetical protein [Planctomycetota bacterium]